MKHKILLTQDNAYIGCRIKIGLPRIYCEINDPHSIIWMKGKVIEFTKGYEKQDKDNKSYIPAMCVIRCIWKKRHHYFKIDRMQCFCRDNGKFDNVYLAKKK